MEKMYNPFLEGTTNEETTVSYILDKALNCSNEQKAVFKFFQYLISNKEKPIYEIRDILRNNYGINMIDFNNYDIL